MDGEEELEKEESGLVKNSARKEASGQFYSQFDLGKETSSPLFE